MEIAAFVGLFKNYCENYRFKETPASAVKPLHFIHFDVENLTAAFKEIQFPAFFLTTPEDDFGGDTVDSITESLESTFIILLPLPNNDISKKAEVIDTAKKIADHIIRRMIRDNAAGILEGLNVPGIKAGPISRTGDSLFGWEVSFNLVQSFDGEIDPEFWADLI